MYNGLELLTYAQPVGVTFPNIIKTMLASDTFPNFGISKTL